MMSAPIKHDQLTLCVTMKGDTAKETAYLKVMLAQAEAYVASFPWNQKIIEKYLGYGVGKVIALFLFRFKKPINGIGEWLWVVVGDLPSAYFRDRRFTRRACRIGNVLFAYGRLVQRGLEAQVSQELLSGCGKADGCARAHAEVADQVHSERDHSTDGSRRLIDVSA
jgi:hypothetical protein